MGVSRGLNRVWVAGAALLGCAFADAQAPGNTSPANTFDVDLKLAFEAIITNGYDVLLGLASLVIGLELIFLSMWLVSKFASNIKKVTREM